MRRESGVGSAHEEPFLGIGILVALVVPAAPALAANQTVTATGGNQFTAEHVGVNVGEMVTWNNGGGLHNVHFDDNSFDMPASPSGAAWSVQRTFNTPGTYRYYCEAHGGPNGVGMSGTVAVNTGYLRPQSASPCGPRSWSRTSNARPRTASTDRRSAIPPATRRRRSPTG